jgi:hypothetical protein
VWNCSARKYTTDWGKLRWTDVFTEIPVTHDQFVVILCIAYPPA